MSFLNSDKLKQKLISGGADKLLGGLPGNLKANFDSNGFKSLSGNFNNIVKKSQRRGRAASPLRDLYKPNGGKIDPPITFPQDLDNEHYMMFNVMDRKRPSKAHVMKSRSIKSIVLPIPSSLTNQHGVSYNSENLQAIGALATGSTTLAGIAQGAEDVGMLIKNKVRAGHKMIMGTDTGMSKEEQNKLEGQITGGVATAAASLAVASGTVLGTIVGLGGLGGAGQLISGIGNSEGVALNPHSAILFDNVNFREFGFNYKFMARNQQESDTLTELIDTFRYYMHPSKNWGGGAFFEYPEEFDITFSETLIPHLFGIRRCVLRSMNVNYNGENTPAFFETTGAPVSIEISLSFQETEILTKEKVTNPNFKDWKMEN